MKSIIIGAGKYGEVYLSYLRNVGMDVVGFLDDDVTKIGTLICGVPVLGAVSTLPRLREKYGVEAVYCPVGDNHFRVNVLQRARELGYETPSYIHPSVIVSPDVQISGNGVYILANTLVMPHVRIGDFVMISVGANIIHHTRLEIGVFVSNGVNLGASISVEPYAYIGMGSTVMTGVNELGRDCLIGAGAVVIRDVPPGGVVAGVPAKVIKYKSGYVPLDIKI